MIDLQNPINWFNPKTGERYQYYDKQGNGIDDVLKWANLFERKKGDGYKVIEQTYTFFRHYWVSTVWLGLDHSFDKFSPPLIFETMVFKVKKNGKPDFSELDASRYTTLEQARKGHKSFVRKWNNPLYIFWRSLDRKTWKFQYWFDKNFGKFFKFIGKDFNIITSFLVGIFIGYLGIFDVATHQVNFFTYFDFFLAGVNLTGGFYGILLQGYHNIIQDYRRLLR